MYMHHGSTITQAPWQHTHACTVAGRQRGRQAGRQAARQAGNQTKMQAYTYRHTISANIKSCAVCSRANRTCYFDPPPIHMKNRGTLRRLKQLSSHQAVPCEHDINEHTVTHLWHACMYAPTNNSNGIYQCIHTSICCLAPHSDVLLSVQQHFMLFIDATTRTKVDKNSCCKKT